MRLVKIGGLSFLLLLGILNPVQNSFIDILIAFFSFSLVTSMVLRSMKWTLLLIVLALTYFFNLKGFQSTPLVGIFLGILCGSVLRILKREGSAVFILIILFMVSAFAISKDLRFFLKTDLPFYTYNNDPGVFLKTFQLMEDGEGYYDAFRESTQGRFLSGIYPPDILGWRLPTVFIVWKLLPTSNGVSIYALYIMLASASLFIAYKIAYKYGSYKNGLVAAYLLFPYLHFGSRDQMLLITEWWGFFFYIFGLYFLLEKKRFFSIVFLLLSVLIRELYIIPVIIIFVYFLLKEKRLYKTLLVPIIGFAFFYIFHILKVSSYINPLESFKFRITTNGLEFIQKTFAFASWEYLLFSFRPFIAFFLLALGASLILLKSAILKRDAVILIASFAFFPIIFLKFGYVSYNDYWGIIFMPTAIILSPLSFPLADEVQT